VRDLDQIDMVRKQRQALVVPLYSHRLRRPVRCGRARPVRAEAELPVRMGEATYIMRLFERRLNIGPALLPEVFETTEATPGKLRFDVLALGHSETVHIRHTQPLRQLSDNIEIRARTFRRINELRPQRDELVASATVDVVMLHEH